MRPNDQKKKELKRLIQNWERYRTLVMGALTGSPVKPRQEREFLRLKAQLAEQIQVLSGCLPRPIGYESKQHLEAMADLVKRHVTLTTRDLGSQWDHEDFENTWHQYFIFLHRLRGMDLSGAEVRPSGSIERPAEVHEHRFWSRLGWTAAFATLAVLIFVMASASGVSLGPTKGLSFSAPQSLNHAVTNAAEAFGTLTAGVQQLVAPVVATYGMIWTLVLAGALVVMLGCVIMMRN